MIKLFTYFLERIDCYHTTVSKGKVHQPLDQKPKKDGKKGRESTAFFFTL